MIEIDDAIIQKSDAIAIGFRYDHENILPTVGKIYRCKIYRRRIYRQATPEEIMEPFPFSDEDWTRVKDVAISIVNASLAEDTGLAESLFEDLKEVLGDLRDTYGEHPVLLETAADFASDPQESLRLYRQAVQLAEQHGLSAESIRVSLIELLARI